MWETTSPRLTHARLGKPINEDNILMSMHDNPAWVSLGNVVSHMACFTRGAKVRATCNCEMCNVCHGTAAMWLWTCGSTLAIGDVAQVNEHYSTQTTIWERRKNGSFWKHFSSSTKNKYF